MAKGPGLNKESLNWNTRFDTGFRIISAYDVGTDGVLTQIDVRVEQRQFTVGFYSSTPIEPKDGQPYLNNIEGNMITPAKGILACQNVVASKVEIIRALKELVSDLENS